jgi:hypothetical protein
MNRRIFRISKQEKYTIISNDVINNPELSPASLGVLVYLLSKPDDWQVRDEELQARFNIGREKLKRVVRELKAAGYLARRQFRGNDGKFFTETLVYEVPSRGVKPDSGNRGVKTGSGSPDSGKPVDILKPESQITESPNTETTTNGAAAVDEIFTLLSNVKKPDGEMITIGRTKPVMAKVKEGSLTAALAAGFREAIEAGNYPPDVVNLGGWVANQIALGASPPLPGQHTKSAPVDNGRYKNGRYQHNRREKREYWFDVVEQKEVSPPGDDTSPIVERLSKPGEYRY